MTLFYMQHMTPFQVQTLSQDEPPSGPLTIQRTPHPAMTAHAPTHHRSIILLFGVYIKELTNKNLQVSCALLFSQVLTADLAYLNY